MSTALAPTAPKSLDVPLPKGKHYVATTGEVREGGRLVVDVAGTRIGIFRVQGALYAYLNRCAHMGGPVCQGLIVPRVIERLNDQRQVIGAEFVENELHIVCPWHGMEFDIVTGRHAGDARIGLRKVDVSEEAEGIYVTF